MKKPQSLLCPFCDLVLLVVVLLLFVEVDQFLVQQLIERFDILRTSLGIAVIPEPILSSADAVHRILDFVVAWRLPRVVLEDSVLHVSRKLAHLASILLNSVLLPNFSLIFTSLICFLKKSR